MQFRHAVRSGMVVTIVTASLCGCGRAGDKALTGDAAAPGAASPARNTRLLDAAEGYEALTETSLDAPIASLEVKRSAAREGAVAVGDLLSPPQQTQLASLDIGLGAALGNGERTAAAIAAVESFRVLVSAQDDSAALPVDVSLLDYAGFKFDALTRSEPVDWNQAAEVAGFARDTWVRLSGRVSAPGLRGAVESALSGMDEAVRLQNEGAAHIAVSDELALVDALEEFFQPPGGQ